MNVQKVNESFYRIQGTHQELAPVTKRLQVERPDARFDPRVKRGIIPSYTSFYNVIDGALIIPSGLINFLHEFNIFPESKNPEFSIQEIHEYLQNVDLPFSPYDHQTKSFIDSITNYSQINLMCTGSGKSLTISLVADFFRSKGKKGLLVVPNINLLTQFKNDIKDYNLIELYDNTHTIGGGQTIKHFNKPFTISTWQSLMNFKSKLDEIDYILVDETHRAKGTQLQDIIQKSTNAKYKLGFTGTLNESAVDRMTLFGLFGLPVTYIRTNGLVKLGLATPVQINSIKFLYGANDKSLFRHTKNYSAQLSFIKDHENRNLFISRLSIQISKNSGNTLVLFQHTNHGKYLFHNIMEELYPEVEVKNKDIVGKKCFDYQNKHKVYFINGEVDADIREQIRVILETETNAILVANYAVLSTGVNIKNLHNMVLASPLKSFTTITQSIGRGVRTHISKEIFNVYDLYDAFTPKGIFVKQYEYRKEQSYQSEGFPIVEKEIYLS